MARGRDPDPPCCQKYGVPLYGAAWVPVKEALKQNPKEEPEQDSDKVTTDEGSSPPPSVDTTSKGYLVCAGGGGEGHSGIPNAVLLLDFDFASNSLSQVPLTKLNTGDDLPYRMAVHPGGEGVICSLPKSCRWFEWDALECTEGSRLGLKSSEKVITQLEGIGQQLAVTFNREGSLIAMGGEDGYLRVFKWPSMEVIVDKADAYATVKDLGFSLDEKFLVSLGNGGPCRIWDVKSATALATLPKENDEVFGFCRFSQTTDNNQILYITAMRGQGGSVVSWNTDSWKRISSKQIVRDPISAFNVSADGKFLAIGTIQGDTFIINSANMRIHTVVRKAHLGLVTALMFSQDSRALVSASMDASARVTLIEDKKDEGSSSLAIVFVILLAILVYLLKSRGVIR